MKPAKAIPGALTKVDLKTGKETHEGMSWQLVPPAPGKCQICASDHGPELPHNRESLFYQMAFHGQVGRWPTWADAAAHCTPQMVMAWKEAMAATATKHGSQDSYKWTEPPEGEAPVKHHGIE